MKKTKVFVASIVLATMLSSSVSAALPYGAIVIGNKSYSVEYITNNAKQFNDILNNSSYKDLYYVKDSSGTITSLFKGGDLKPGDSGYVSEDIITHYVSNGKQVPYKKQSNGDYLADSNLTVKLEISSKVTKLGNSGLMLMSITIPDKDKMDLSPSSLKGEYFKVINKNNSDLVKKIGKIPQGQEDDYTINLLTTDPKIKIQILTSDKSPIATTEIVELKEGITTVQFFNLENSNPENAYNGKNGNGLGNLNNNGLIAQDGGWKYYSHSADGGGIYKTNDVISEKICEDNAKFINVVGDYIYYVNYSDGQKIYKIKKDGTGRRIVSTDQASYLTVSGEYIYYTYHSGRGVGNIKKVSKNANKSTGINITNDEAEYLTISGDIIYFVNKSEGNSIYSVHTDGTYRSKISSDRAKFITLSERNDKIYYITDSGQLKAMNKSGSNVADISVTNGTTGKNAIITTMNVSEASSSSNNYIYYTDASDGNKIYRAPLTNYLKVTGEKYSNDYANFINIVDDKIYYTKGNNMSIANEPQISPNRDPYGRAIYTYSSTPLVKPKRDLKIISYDKVATPKKDAIGADINNLEEYLPDKVTAVMSDNSVRELLVNWDLNPKNNGKGGAASYTGVIVGYGAKVTLVLSMASESIPSESVRVVNNAGLAEDKIFVNIEKDGTRTPIQANLQIGDVIKVYRDKNMTQLLGQEVVFPSIDDKLNVTIILRKDKTLPDDATAVYVTRTSQNMIESAPTVCTIKPEDDLVGVPDGIDKSLIKIIKYGIMQDGYTVNSKVKIMPNTTLKAGDMVNVYIKDNNQRYERIGYGIGTPVYDSDIWADIKCEATIDLSAQSLANSSDGRLYITRSTQLAESKDSNGIEIPQGIALPLEGLDVIGDPNDLTVIAEGLNPFISPEYEYKYKVVKGGVGSDEIPEERLPVLGASVSDGWTTIDKDNPRIKGQNLTSGDIVYVVNTYNGKAFKAGYVNYR
ncbi:MAG: DUF5050 domain-containing protein [Clostridiaceae bacterium]